MAWLDCGEVECLYGDESAQRQGLGGDQVSARRHGGHRLHVQHHVFGLRLERESQQVGQSDHRVAPPEAGDVRPQRVDGAGDVPAEAGDLPLREQATAVSPPDGYDRGMSAEPPAPGGM